MVIGLDIGTSSVKGVLLDEAARVRAQAEHPHSLRHPAAGWAEEDPEDWWAGTLKVLQRLREAAVSAPIHALGVSGMVPALVLHGPEGQVLRPSIQQNDARAVGEIAHLREVFGDEALFARTGATWNQQVVAPKLLWLKRNEPEVWAHLDWLSGSYEHIVYRLCGARYTEANWALESGLWNPHQQVWLEEVLDYLELPPRVLAPVRFPQEVVGHLKAEVAARTGLPEGLPIIAGSADHIAAALAAGLQQEGEAVIKLGSAGDFLYVSPTFTPLRELYIDYHDLPGLFVLNGCMASSGTLLEWFRRNFRPGASFATLDAEAARVPAGAEGLVVLPYFLGEKTPFSDPLARGSVLGLTLQHTPSHLYRALLEAVAYAFRHHVEVLESYGHRVRRYLVMDGGARSPLWRSILASVLGQEVHYLAQSAQGSAYGVGFLAGMALGQWNLEALPLEVAGSTSPQEEWREVYHTAYGLYREAYPSLQRWFAKLGGINA
ncbi:FGGY-family carbohydrate kinase [Meiothermus granaticius]|uniref:Xylulose kinase n=1 Tax=Meiothermus granaticius NBRC 107808 TaxID=1227551 RepID=A0A399F7K4_9DEIN|nr:FGGY family carbohydrate kinase [Meiothermus granaticius]RIH91646.1 Xylulose kinase [Meiothermus granaticius NBRC 107808]GEM88383.1 carbohydrate kinase [Meiothermus granaticius NBRC 107808]